MSNQGLYRVDEQTEELVRLQRLVKGSILTGSDQELNAFFGDLKSAVLIVDTDFRIMYLNNTATNLNIDKTFDAVKGTLVIEYIKRILHPSTLLHFYESLINRTELKLEGGFALSRIEKLLFHPIANEGFVVKILLDELYTVSASNLFRYFPGMPIGYFGFDLLPGRKLSVRFVGDNFHSLFPYMDMERLLKEEQYLLNFVHPEDLPDTLARLQNNRRGKDVLNLELRMVDEKGESKWFRIIAGRFSEKTEKHFWLGYIEDIHEKKSAALDREKLVHETLDDERHRMSMELHDGLGQNLVALNLYISSLASQENEEVVGTCRQLTIDSIMLMKSMCYNLAPPELEKGLLHALDVFFGKSNELSTSIEYSYNAKVGHVKPLESERAYNIFRIVQEFVTNSRKYASCSKIECEVTVRRQKTILMLHDNGVGFDMDKIKNGFGLKNMQNRAKIADAHLELSSNPGEGTLLVLEF
jgi:signal transduction histidine kinase